jgi:hypothetical protein
MRLTRLTNAHGKKAKYRFHVLTLYFIFYNSVHVYKT